MVPVVVPVVRMVPVVRRLRESALPVSPTVARGVVPVVAVPMVRRSPLRAQVPMVGLHSGARQAVQGPLTSPHQAVPGRRVAGAVGVLPMPRLRVVLPVVLAGMVPSTMLPMAPVVAVVRRVPGVRQHHRPR